ncbi:MAG: ABC transporter substrate-binding protein [Spirochaetales bacterium]|nr:ABC transporter substrate-binding protein [Spirochaetales bacterium]
MKKKIILTMLIGALCFSPLFSAGQQEKKSVNPGVAISETAEGTSKPEWLVENTDEYITIIDCVGNQVTINKPVNTVIAEGMGEVFAVIKALKAEELIVASNDYVMRNEAFFPVIANLPPISEGGAVDYEKIISLDPDLLCMDPDFYHRYEALASEVTIIQLSFESTKAVSILGAILDREDEATEFIEWIESYTNVVDERIQTLSKEELKDVFFYYGGEYGMSPPPPYGTFGSDNFLKNELIRKAGGRSLSRDIPGNWVAVDPEWVIEQNPKMIIRECYIVSQTPEMGYGVNDLSGAKTLMDNISEQPAFESSDAVKTGNVHMIYGDLVTDSWFVSLIYLAKWFHPDLFNDLDPEKMHQEYITRFQRLDFDVSKQGIFSYSLE